MLLSSPRFPFVFYSDVSSHNSISKSEKMIILLNCLVFNCCLGGYYCFVVLRAYVLLQCPLTFFLYVPMGVHLNPPAYVNVLSKFIVSFSISVHLFCCIFQYLVKFKSHAWMVFWYLASFITPYFYVLFLVNSLQYCVCSGPLLLMHMHYAVSLVEDLSSLRLISFPSLFLLFTFSEILTIFSLPYRIKKSSTNGLLIFGTTVPKFHHPVVN